MKFLNTTKYRMTILVVMVMLLQLLMPVVGDVVWAEGEDLKISHTNEITTKDCEREIKGEIKFTTPFVEKKLDLIIVQDASGSFENTIGKMKNGLIGVVETLEKNYGTEKNRVMVTTYRGGTHLQPFEWKNRSPAWNGDKTDWDWSRYDKSAERDKFGDLQKRVRGGYQSWVPLTIKTEQELTNDFEEVKEAINKIEVKGATPTALGLKHAFQVYNEGKGKYDPLREAIFLFVTDGIANVREDGYIWVDRYLTFQNGKEKQAYSPVGDGFSETRSDFRTAIYQASQWADAIKKEGYYLISTFIEDPNVMVEQYGNVYNTFYKNTVSPYAKEKLKAMATGPAYYMDFDKVDNFGESVSDILKNLISVINSNKIEIEIEEGYEVIEAKLYKGDEVIKEDLELKPGENSILIKEFGDYRIEYTIREEGYYNKVKTPVKVKGIYFNSISGVWRSQTYVTQTSEKFSLNNAVVLKNY